MPDASPSITRGHEAQNDQNRNAQTNGAWPGIKRFLQVEMLRKGDGLAGGVVMDPPASFPGVLRRWRCLAPAALSLVLGLYLTSCMAAQKKHDHNTNISTTTFVGFGTDAEALTVDGPPPSMIGTLPVLDKKGVIVGYKPVYGMAAGAAGGTGNALIAAYGVNHSKSFGKAANVVTTTALGMVAAGVQKAKDSATAANEAKQIAADKAAADGANKLAAQAEANRHAEKLMEFEVPAPAVTP